MEAERTVVRWLKEHGWPHAERTGALTSGIADRGDIVGLPVLVDVKNRKRIDLGQWLDQVAEAKLAHAADVPGLVVVKRRRVADPAGWYAVTTLADFNVLLHDAERDGWTR